MNAPLLSWLKCISALPLILGLSACGGREMPESSAQAAPIPQTILIPGNSNTTLAPAATPPSPTNPLPATAAATSTTTGSQPVAATSQPSVTNATSAGLPQPVAEPRILQPVVGELSKLAKSGVAESVMLAYLEQSPIPATVTTEEIVYLTDLGVAPSVITLLIQRRDQAAKTGTAISTNAAGVAAAPAPPGAPATGIVPPPPAPAPQVVTPTYVQGPPQTTVLEQPPVVVQQPVIVQQPTTIAYFHDSLAPYGSWVDVDGYGRCWAPSLVTLGSDWRPYGQGGRWIWTEHGWYWYSDYPWGWATFHYGRWHHHPRHQWVWVPDMEWGPAWVCWRRTSSHCGWAPLPPGAHYRGSRWSFGVDFVGSDFGFGLSYSSFSFVHWSRFCDPRPYHHYASTSHAQSLYRGSTVVNNTIVGNNNTIIFEGAGRQNVQAASRTPIPQATLRETAYQTASTSVRERLDTSGNSAMIVNSPRIPSAPPSRPGSANGSGKWAPAASAPAPASPATSGLAEGRSTSREDAFRQSRNTTPSSGSVGVSSPFIPATRSTANQSATTVSPTPTTTIRSTPNSGSISTSPSQPSSFGAGGKYSSTPPTSISTAPSGPAPASPAPRVASPFQPSVGRPLNPAPTSTATPGSVAPAQRAPAAAPSSPFRREAGSAFQPSTSVSTLPNGSSSFSSPSTAPRTLSQPTTPSSPAAVPHWMRESSGRSISSTPSSSPAIRPVVPSTSFEPTPRTIQPSAPSPAFTPRPSPAFTPRSVPSPSITVPRSEMGAPRNFSPSPSFTPSRTAPPSAPAIAPSAPRVSPPAPAAAPAAPAARNPASRRNDP